MKNKVSIAGYLSLGLILGNFIAGLLFNLTCWTVFEACLWQITYVWIMCWLLPDIHPFITVAVLAPAIVGGIFLNQWFDHAANWDKAILRSLWGVSAIIAYGFLLWLHDKMTKIVK